MQLTTDHSVQVLMDADPGRFCSYIGTSLRPQHIMGERMDPFDLAGMACERKSRAGLGPPWWWSGISASVDGSSLISEVFLRMVSYSNKKGIWAMSVSLRHSLPEGSKTRQL